MKSSKNVILIGMPGSGKSTVGVVLAKVLGYRFIDSDLEIQSQEGKRLPELIEEFGVALQEGQTLQSLYEERIPLYEKYADITVDETNMSVEETMEQVVLRYRSRK